MLAQIHYTSLEANLRHFLHLHLSELSFLELYFEILADLAIRIVGGACDLAAFERDSLCFLCYI